MATQSREKALLEIVRRGLFLASAHTSTIILGDRSTYLGMSDLARYAECPRAAVAGKLDVQDFTLEHLLTLQRGHWFEDGIVRCLGGAGLRFMRQMEIAHTHAGVPLRAHLDLVLVWDKPRPAVRVLEIKSMETLPNEPYPAHERQVKGQVSMLEELWDAPEFTLRRDDGAIAHARLNFPELCRRELGVNLPNDPEKVSVEGWLLCLSMCDARAFGPYLPDADVLESLREQAVEYWAAFCAVREGKAALNDIPHVRGFYPLCASCGYAADCPRFPQAADMPQWEPALDKLAVLKEQRSELDTEIREVESALRLAHRLAIRGKEGNGGWITAGSYRFKVSRTEARRTLDRATLRDELSEILRLEHLEDIDVDALLKRHEKVGASSSRLSVNKIH